MKNILDIGPASGFYPISMPIVGQSMMHSPPLIPSYKQKLLVNGKQQNKNHLDFSHKSEPNRIKFHNGKKKFQMKPERQPAPRTKKTDKRDPIIYIKLTSYCLTNKKDQFIGFKRICTNCVNLTQKTMKKEHCISHRFCNCSPRQGFLSRVEM